MWWVGFIQSVEGFKSKPEVFFHLEKKFFLKNINTEIL